MNTPRPPASPGVTPTGRTPRPPNTQAVPLRTELARRLAQLYRVQCWAREDALDALRGAR